MKLVTIEQVMRRLAPVKLSDDCRPTPQIFSAQDDNRQEPMTIELASAAAARPPELVEAKGLANHAAERAMKLIAARPARARKTSAAPGRIGRFLDWAQTANPEERAQAASALARAYLCSDLPNPMRRAAQAGRIAKLKDLRRDAEVCLTTLVKDESSLVRRALAEGLASEPDAPRHIISALANDEPEIAAIVLARSPLLGDAELLEYAAIGGESALLALASRPRLNQNVALSLAEFDRRDVAIALVENRDARLTSEIMGRIAERFGEDGEVRSALLARSELSATMRYELFAIAARALPPLTVCELGEKRVERMMRDTLEQCALLVANSCRPDEIQDLMRRLRVTGVLTAALLVRALISGGRGFFEAAAVELTGVSPRRVAGFMCEPFGAGFAALYRRMGLPKQFITPFRAALAALEEFGADESNRVSRPVISQVIAFCEREQSSSLSCVIALLRRLEAEGALEEARALVERAATQRAAAQPYPDGRSVSPAAAIEPGISKLLLLLRSLEAEGALDDLETAETMYAAPCGMFEDTSLAA
jgi:uncharacterized protein (DUF2336 family)